MHDQNRVRRRSASGHGSLSGVDASAFTTVASVSTRDGATSAWDDLGPAWQQCFELAWQSFRDGGVAVGAVVVDAGGQVLGSGRNQRYGPATGAPVTGLLGHAELNALAAGLPADKTRPRDTRLYTTLQPCPMCAGAMVVARVSELRFAAYDPTWAGVERLPDLNPEVRARWPVTEGPLPGPIGMWAAILPVLNTSGSLADALQRSSAKQADLGKLIASALHAQELPDTALQALRVVWDLLSEASEAEN